MNERTPKFDPGNLHRLMTRGQAGYLIDVRRRAEYADGRAPEALFPPLEQMDARQVRAA